MLSLKHETRQLIRPGLNVAFYMRPPNQIVELNACKMRRFKTIKFGRFESNASSVEYSTVPVSLPFIAVLCGLNNVK